jgi:hypothetical protein
MTPQEAIKQFEFEKEMIAFDAITGESKTFSCLDKDIKIVADSMAIEALEKQIPKKPIKSKEQAIRYTASYVCPTCKMGFTGTGIADYCYHCGQRLDWEEEDGKID